MCGIAGILRFDGRAAAPELLQAMRGHLRHRGPDDEGCYNDGPLGLAFRRLAILDLTSAGHQPMASADGSHVLVFNGEVYNFRELRAELEAHGHRFRSETDSEVLLAAYAQWGVDCLSRLSGMWAFAIWDSRQRRLFCARDRFGIKPFYYHLDGARFVFASEIKALFADPATPNLANDRRIYDFLVYANVDHTDETCFADILQLPAAHCLLIDEQGQPTVRRYWDLDPSQHLDLSDTAAIEGFRELFTDSVRRHLQSDVPVGTCLSGGLDSSSIVVVVNKLLREQGLARTVIGDQQKTFSACYEDLSCDERRFIQPVVAQTGVANAQTFPSGERLLADLEQFVWQQEQPVTSTRMYSQWAVMRLAHEQGITVLLDGQGGDEILAGYPIYQAAYWATLARAGHLHTLQQEMATYRNIYGRERMLRMREALRLALPEAISVRVASLLGSDRPTWLGPRASRSAAGRPRIPNPFSDPLRRQLYSFLVSLNLPALLRYEDRSSMAFSIEARVPFLDERLVEFAFALKGNQLIRDSETKWVLRRALGGLLPQEVRDRHDKMGFTTPGDEWLRRELAPLVDEIVASSSLAQRGYINQQALRERWRKHREGSLNDHYVLWRCLHLELWARRFLDRRPEAGEPGA